MQPINRIVIEFIPHADQRYDTVGDWQHIDDVLTISISRMPGHPLWEQAVAIHELVEALLCNAAGITQAIVDKWDMEIHADSADPGSEPGCPYREAHSAATDIEYQFLITHLDEDWHEYDKYLDSLGMPPEVAP